MYVRSGAGGDLAVTVDGIYESPAFADVIRAQIGDHLDETHRPDPADAAASDDSDTPTVSLTDDL